MITISIYHSTSDFTDIPQFLNNILENYTFKLGHYFCSIPNSTCCFNGDMVLYSKLRPYLNKVVLPNKTGYATSELVPLNPVKEKLNKYFLASLLRSKCFVDDINVRVAGAKMPRVSMDYRQYSLVFIRILTVILITIHKRKNI